MNVPKPLGICLSCFARIEELGTLTDNGAVLLMYCSHHRVSGALFLDSSTPFWQMNCPLSQKEADDVFAQVRSSHSTKRRKPNN